MKILLTSFFINARDALPVFADHYGRWFISCFEQERIDVKFLMNESLYRTNQVSHQLDFLHPILFSLQDATKIFKNNQIDWIDLYHHIHHDCKEGLPTEEEHKLASWLQKKLNNWTPDIILAQSYHSMKMIMQHIYPHALCLTQENAIFSRPPFGRTLCYDPFNSVPINFLVKYANELHNFQITDEQNAQIENLKRSIRKIIDKKSPLHHEMKQYKRKFKKLVLLPLVGQEGISLLRDCICNTELELVEYVLQNVPEDIGVFVTQSDLFATLAPADIAYFRGKYPHFIFLEKTDSRGFANNSLNYFQYIDALLNITSKTGLMAMLWDVPVLSLAKKYNSWYQDSQDIHDLPALLSKGARNKNHLLYWYFTRYVIFEQDFAKPNFLFNFFQNKLQCFRTEGIRFDFFEQINTIDKITPYIMESIKRNMTAAKRQSILGKMIKLFQDFVLSFYSTSHGYNIKLFGCIKTKIWPKKQEK